jgi:hypothetical protein
MQAKYLVRDSLPPNECRVSRRSAKANTRKYWQSAAKQTRVAGCESVADTNGPADEGQETQPDAKTRGWCERLTDLPACRRPMTTPPDVGWAIQRSRTILPKRVRGDPGNRVLQSIAD